jgi:hypothetical protein
MLGQQVSSKRISQQRHPEMSTEGLLETLREKLSEAEDARKEAVRLQGVARELARQVFFEQICINNV